MAYNYLTRTEDHLYSRMGDVGSEMVTLRRGAASNASVQAIVAKLDAVELQAGVVLTQMNFVCFRLYAEAYKPDADGDAVTPEEGDEFERANGNVYRVASPPDDVSSNRNPYEYTTSSQVRIKVWTQLVVKGNA